MRRPFPLSWPATCADCGERLDPGSLAVYYGRGYVFGRGCHQETRVDFQPSKADAPIPAGMTLLRHDENELTIRWDLTVYDHVHFASLGSGSLEDGFGTLREEAESLDAEVVVVRLRRDHGQWTCDLLASGEDG